MPYVTIQGEVLINIFHEDVFCPIKMRPNHNSTINSYFSIQNIEVCTMVSVHDIEAVVHE